MPKQNPSTNNVWLPFMLRACLVVGVVLGGILWKWGDSLSFGNGWLAYTLLGLASTLTCIGLISDLVSGPGSIIIPPEFLNPTMARWQRRQLIIWQRDQRRRQRMNKKLQESDERKG